jgi:hypothetical protein
MHSERDSRSIYLQARIGAAELPGSTFGKGTSSPALAFP